MLDLSLNFFFDIIQVFIKLTYLYILILKWIWNLINKCLSNKNKNIDRYDKIIILSTGKIKLWVLHKVSKTKISQLFLSKCISCKALIFQAGVSNMYVVKIRIQTQKSKIFKLINRLTAVSIKFFCL